MYFSRLAMLCRVSVVFLQISTILAVRYNTSGIDANAVSIDHGDEDYADSRVRFENSLVNDANDEADTEDFKSTICSTFPATCSGLSSLSRRFFSFGGFLSAFEGRGPRDLIAIVSTMLATLLGAILVKLNVLIVLSMISVGIGKLLVLILTLKSHLFAHKTHQQPVVYEKVYYPHHREYINSAPQSYHEDYPAYNLSR